MYAIAYIHTLIERPAGSPQRDPDWPRCELRRALLQCRTHGHSGQLEAAMPEVVSPTQTKARRLRLAEELIAHGRVSQNPKHPMAYHVSALDNRHAYVVCLTGPKLCTCADSFYRRIHCKHYLAASLVHIATVARHEEQQARRSAKIAHRVTCADCQSEMPATDPCPDCGRLVCDKCFDGMSGVCLGCPGGV